MKIMRNLDLSETIATLQASIEDLLIAVVI